MRHLVRELRRVAPVLGLADHGLGAERLDSVVEDRRAEVRQVDPDHAAAPRRVHPSLALHRDEDLPHARLGGDVQGPDRGGTGDPVLRQPGRALER